jgi:hypothetical protein
MFKTIAIITAIALTTTACSGPQQTYKNYAKKVNAERKELGLKNHQWSPTEKKVMGPVVAIAGAHIIGGAIAGKGAAVGCPKTPGVFTASCVVGGF